MKYNIVDNSEQKTVTVITPTIGSPNVQDAIDRVRDQTYKNLKHLIVVDGPEHLPKAIEIVGRNSHNSLQVVTTPENTGGGGFYGHRIYAGYAHLINSDYIFFLDEDNWYEIDHVESLVEVLDQGNEFAYSLRKIFDPDKNYICDDNCESLGKWPIFFTHNQSEQHYLIDTSSFAFKKEFIIRTSQFWHHGWGGDRHYFYNVKDRCKWDTSGKHTLCYRLDGNPKSVSKDFFDEGNASMKKIYGDKFPWIKD